MKLETYLIIYFIFLFVKAQDEEAWKSVYVAFSEKNWDDQGWIVNYIYGDKFNQCGSQKLFGGYGSFGYSTMVSKYFFSLPIHYSIKVSLIFYKIDSWDSQYFQINIDNEVYIRAFGPQEGGNACGAGYGDLAVPISFTIQHHSKSLVVMMAASLDEHPTNESWGFCKFEIQILACPEGCQYCQDSTSDCQFWNYLASFWQTSFNSEGWSTDNNEPLASSICGGIEILGGTSVLLQGQKIEISLDNLNLHYEVQIVFKLWVIGNWNQELFTLLIDDQIASNFTVKTGGYLNFECGFYQQVKIINCDINASHSAPQIKLAMKTQKIISKNAFWGLQSFDLFTAECPQGCAECYGYQKNQCSKCKKKWVLLSDGCIPLPPIECAQVRISQLNDFQENLENSLEIYFDELERNFKEIGQTNFILKETISNISFSIYVKCKEKLNITSFFRNCEKCQSDQYSFSNQCSDKSNTLIFTATFMQAVKYEKELLITISEQQLEMHQLLQVNEIDEYVLILKINF
ncbi:unnamed protein product [Paramecium sonneborni]|uniref:Uncharacterized protein n=1 Tax=Paramecium sonneborni TaxID=65129 RepID=A0A8S1QXN5_9CILI|nr:unnamed protein product [Paramecium sonneborni]